MLPTGARDSRIKAKPSPRSNRLVVNKPSGLDLGCSLPRTAPAETPRLQPGEYLQFKGKLYCRCSSASSLSAGKTRYPVPSQPSCDAQEPLSFPVEFIWHTLAAGPVLAVLAGCFFSPPGRGRARSVPAPHHHSPPGKIPPSYGKSSLLSVLAWEEQVHLLSAN